MDRKKRWRADYFVSGSTAHTFWTQLCQQNKNNSVIAGTVDRCCRSCCFLLNEKKRLFDKCLVAQNQWNMTAQGKTAQLQLLRTSIKAQYVSGWQRFYTTQGLSEKKTNDKSRKTKCCILEDKVQFNKKERVVRIQLLPTYNSFIHPPYTEQHLNLKLIFCPPAKCKWSFHQIYFP